MNKGNIVLISLGLGLLLSGCGGGGGESSSLSSSSASSSSSSTGFSSSSEPSSSAESSSSSNTDPNWAQNYDFGDEGNWAGDKMANKDLGDCLLNAYPYDEMYDWGQSIMYDSEDEIYKMWWCRQSGYDTVWYAESHDLKHWDNAQKIMTVSEDSTWIKMHVGKPTVLKIDGHYRMYFEAPATILEEKEFNNNVMMATSEDGIHFDMWTNGGAEAYPVIRMTDEDLAASIEYSKTSAAGYGYYGIGQPSACYKDGTYYLYVTYSLLPGDRMYCFTSKDGITFGEGKQVFMRAGTGVKYNTKTETFMMAYEYTIDRQSKIYYMESKDGFQFTYSDLLSAASNVNILSRSGGFVRGYPDFVANELGQVDGYTIYVAYMEGRMADLGNDWRQYSPTWDIHIAMFNLAPYANRTMVLPNGYILNDDTYVPYQDKHVEYDDKIIGIQKSSALPVIDGSLDPESYSKAITMEIDRESYAHRAVPSSLKGTIKMSYTSESLFFFIEAFDETKNDDDEIYVLFDEKRFASTENEIINITATRNSILKDDGAGTVFDNSDVAFKETSTGYCLEAKLPWRFLTEQAANDSFGFDCYLINEKTSKDFKSITAFNDFRVGYDIHQAGEIYFL